MKKVLLLIFLSLLFVQKPYAQNSESIVFSGKVIDSISHENLEYATVFLTENSTKQVYGSITKANGDFHVITTPGNYTISIEFLSYQSKIFNDIQITKDYDLGTVNLSASTESLDVVEINTNTKLNDIKVGREVLNIENNTAIQGETATDVLENAPSVSVLNGVPKIHGLNATIMINGRISAMTKPEALQNLQASSIKRIEVITMPSARYQGEVNGGIINIILNKGVDYGFNGAITTIAGIKDIYGASTSVNHRSKNLNIYSNTSYVHRNPIASTIIENEYLENGEAIEYLDENRKNSRKNRIFNTTIGADYYLSDNTSLNIEGSYANYNGNFNTGNTTNYFDSAHLLTYSTEQLLKTDHSDNIYEISTSYKHYFQRENELIFINISHSNDTESNNSELFYSELFPNPMNIPERNELIYDDLNLKNTAWETYYRIPTTKNSTLEMGIDGKFETINTDFINKKIVDGGYEIDPNSSNLLKYNEDVFGFYSEFKKQCDKLSYNISLRVEHTNLDVNLTTTNEKSSQNYTDFFPAINLGYSFSETKSLNLSYRRNIGRVGYDYLNPFEQRVSETVSYVGNINLLPYYSNNIELSYSNLTNSKLNLTPTLYYRRFNETWQPITIESGDIINGVPKIITTPINLGSLNYTGIELTSTYKPLDWIDFDSTLDLSYTIQKGEYQYTDSKNEIHILNYDNEGINGTYELLTNIKLPLDINFHTFFKYYLQSEGAYSKKYGYYRIKAGLSKEILNKKATISLIANDIFNTDKTKRIRWSDDFNSLSNYQWREPYILLSFTYRFNQQKKKENKHIDINKKDIKEKI